MSYTTHEIHTTPSQHRKQKRRPNKTSLVSGIGRWAEIFAVPASLHVVFAVIVPNHLLDAAAWGLAAIGLAAAALRVLKTSDDNWDLAPN